MSSKLELKRFEWNDIVNDHSKCLRLSQEEEIKFLSGKSQNRKSSSPPLKRPSTYQTGASRSGFKLTYPIQWPSTSQSTPRKPTSSCLPLVSRTASFAASSVTSAVMNLSLCRTATLTKLAGRASALRLCSLASSMSSPTQRTRSSQPGVSSTI